MTIRWTEAEKVALVYEYVSVIEGFPHLTKGEHFTIAQKEVLRSDRYRGLDRSGLHTASIYTVLDHLLVFARDNREELFPDLHVSWTPAKKSKYGLAEYGKWVIYRLKKEIVKEVEDVVQEVELIETPKPAAAPFAVPTMTEVVLQEMRNTLQLAARAHDDQLQTFLELINERITRLEERINVRDAQILEALEKLTAHSKKEKIKKPSVLLIGGLASQAEEIRHKLGWVSIDAIKEISEITGKSYDLVILWARFISHSHQEKARQVYGKAAKILPPNGGVTSVVEMIKAGITKAHA